MLDCQDSKTECGAGVAGLVGEGFTVKETVALLVLSVWLVACTLICIVALTTGAVNSPAESITPAVADHFTVAFALLPTTAVNCWVFPEKMIALEGDAETVTPLVPLRLPPTERPPPQAARKIGPERTR